MTLRMGQRLQELGFKSNSDFTYILSKKGWNINYKRTKRQLAQQEFVGNEIVPLPTTEEIADKLPAFFSFWKLFIGRDGKNIWHVSYRQTKGRLNHNPNIMHTESNRSLKVACCLMWIYLKEHKYI